MGRRRNADPVELAMQLAAVKTLIADSANATPSMARDLRLNACEQIDEVIAQLATPLRVRKARALAFE